MTKSKRSLDQYLYRPRSSGLNSSTSSTSSIPNKGKQASQLKQQSSPSQINQDVLILSEDDDDDDQEEDEGEKKENIQDKNQLQNDNFIEHVRTRNNQQQSTLDASFFKNKSILTPKQAQKCVICELDFTSLSFVEIQSHTDSCSKQTKRRKLDGSTSPSPSSPPQILNNDKIIDLSTQLYSTQSFEKQGGNENTNGKQQGSQNGSQNSCLNLLESPVFNHELQKHNPDSSLELDLEQINGDGNDRSNDNDSDEESSQNSNQNSTLNLLESPVFTHKLRRSNSTPRQDTESDLEIKIEQVDAKSNDNGSPDNQEQSDDEQEEKSSSTLYDNEQDSSNQESQFEQSMTSTTYDTYYDDSQNIILDDDDDEEEEEGDECASEEDNNESGVDMDVEADDIEQFEEEQDEEEDGGNDAVDEESKMEDKEDDDEHDDEDDDIIIQEASASTSTSISTTKTSNAFSTLMQGNKQVQQWKSADKQKVTNSKFKFKPSEKKCPFYKIIDPFPFAVDAFNYGKIENITCYFLTHAHGDHYTNLSSSWNHGPIYCSQTTANLIKLKLGVKEEWIKPLELDKTYLIDGVDVTLIDANHCPGSVLFLFEKKMHKNKAKIRHLHCGDFRASPKQILHPNLRGRQIDTCYLDTTYLNHKYTFPAQEQVIEECAKTIRQASEGHMDTLDKKESKSIKSTKKQADMLSSWLKPAKAFFRLQNDSDDEVKEKDKELESSNVSSKRTNKKLLVIIGTYSIGKENIVKGIANELNSKIFCNKSKRDIYNCIEDDDEFTSKLTSDPYDAQVHVTNLFNIRNDTLSEYLDQYKDGFNKIIALRPTGWSFKGDTNHDPKRLPSVTKIINDLTNDKPLPTILTKDRGSTSICQSYSVCYSEHSSFSELTCFSVSLNPKRIIPTVNLSPQSREKMQIWFRKWKEERKHRDANGLTSLVVPRNESYW